MEKIIISVDDYGAVGDGVTNDAEAIIKAAKFAASQPAEIKKEIIFSCEKTYRILSLPEDHKSNCLFDFENACNISVEGKGAKLLFKGKIMLVRAINCVNFGIQGFVIDYSPKPFIISNLIGKDEDLKTMDFEASADTGIGDTPFETDQLWFAFPNRADMRYHYFFDRYEKIGDCRYRLHLSPITESRIKDANVGDEFLLPHFGGSHFSGGLCTFYDCRNLYVGYLRVYAMPEFGFDIRSNKGEIVFNDITLKPCDNAKEHLVSWRDGFHVKDNLSPVVWNHCYIGTLGDDAFNLSCVHLDVTSVGEDGKTVSALPAEKGKTRPINPGDELVAYDLDTGREIGRSEAETVIASDEDVKFVMRDPMPLLKPGMQISFYKFANPGFVVKNSYIEGTVRVRSSGTFQNCNFNVFWVRVENEYFVEGPIPKNAFFRNCSFTTPYDENSEIFHVGTLGRNGITNCEYKCKNIVLDNCRFLKGTYHADEGNELIIK